MIKKHNTANNGFTLIELLLVLGIIGIIMVLVIPRAMRAQTESKFSLVRQYGSEMSGYIMTWAEQQARSQRQNTNFTIKDFLYDDISASEAGFNSNRIVDKYTGNEDYNGVEMMVPPEKMPRNPFNQASYFSPNNDDTLVPSSKPGLLYLAARKDPLDKDYLNFYLLFTSTGEDGEGSRWHSGMRHLDDDLIRKGVFVARLYDDEEYGGTQEDLQRWKRRMR